MSLQFVLGGAGRGKTYYVQHMLLEAAEANPDKEYIMIVPEQFTMATQKELVRLSKNHGIMNIDVQSFLRLAFRVFSETGAAGKPVLDDLGKTMILKKVLSDNKENLVYFGRNINKKGYISEIKSFLSELIQYGADEEMILNMIEASAKKPVLEQKLKDIYTAYKVFTGYIKDNYITSEEVLSVLSEVVPQSEILKNSVICLDGFTGFTPLQYKLINELMNVADEVFVTVTIDKGQNIWKRGAKHQLFYMSQNMIYHLRKIAEENSVEICPEIWTGLKDEESRFAESESLSFLEKNIFRYPLKMYDKEQNDISIHELTQPENEISFVVEKIGELLRDGNCSYKDIAIVAGNLEEYGMLVKSAMEEAGFPCFIDQKKSVLANPFVMTIDALLDILIKDFSYEDVMKYLKGSFSWITEEQMSLADNFLLATGIRGHKKWTEEWECSYVFNHMTDQALEYVNEQLNYVRESGYEKFGKLYEKIARGKHTVREYCQSLCEYMESQNFYADIMTKAEKFSENDEPELAREYEQIYGIVIDVLDRLVELLGDESMNLAEFKEIIDVGFSEARIGLIPPGVDQILAGDISRTRLSDIKYLFFIGVNDGNIPKSGNGGGILSEAERIFLSEEDYELAPTPREEVYTEQFYLYLNMAKPSNHLYITYCVTGNDGKAKSPSYIVDRIKRLFPKMSVSIEEARKDTTHILSDDMGKRYLIRGLRDKDYSDSKWQELYKYYVQSDDKEMTQKLIGAAFYREGKSQISKAAAEGLYGEIIKGSTSQLERYSACAFSYFMKYGLKLEERAERKVEFFDIGNIVHKALEIYTKKLLENGQKWEDIDVETQKKKSWECLEAAVEGYKNGLLHDTKRDEYMITRLKKLMNRTVWAITEQMKLGKFDTVTSELSFDVVEKEEGVMHLIGKVDRIDMMTENDKSYVSIVDYKTGKKELSLSDMYYGLQMQLVIYLEAAKNHTQKKSGKKLIIPAGVFYYNIDDPLLEGKIDPDKISENILKELRMEGMVNEDDPVLPSIDSNFATTSGELPIKTKSVVAPFETDKNGNLKKNSSTVQTKQFEDIINYTRKNISKMAGEIKNGKTEINPYKKDDSSMTTACDYCSYKDVCRFDVRIPGNVYRSLKKLTDDDVLNLISSEDNNKQE